MTANAMMTGDYWYPGYYPNYYSPQNVPVVINYPPSGLSLFDHLTIIELTKAINRLAEALEAKKDA